MEEHSINRDRPPKSPGGDKNVCLLLLRQHSRFPERPLLGCYFLAADGKVWAVAVWLLFIPIAAVPLLGVAIMPDASERLEVVASRHSGTQKLPSTGSNLGSSLRPHATERDPHSDIG
jgi:hypothetical protein